MVLDSKQKMMIGRAETVVFPTLADTSLSARIDTGAKTSSIWATDINKQPDGSLIVRIASPDYEIYNHEVVFADYETIRVASSMGHVQERYKVKIPIRLGGRRIIASFTLSDRSTQVYPVLIGRSTLNGKFIVDVSEGVPLTEKEKQRSAQIQSVNERGE